MKTQTPYFLIVLLYFTIITAFQFLRSIFHIVKMKMTNESVNCSVMSNSLQLHGL